MIIFRLKSVILVGILLPLQMYGQKPLLNDQKAVDSIRVTLAHIYNFEFDSALVRILNEDGNLDPHPANHLLNAMVIYWRDRPLAPDTEPYMEFERILHETVRLSESFREEEALYEEGVFYALCGYALLAELYSEQGTSLRVLNMAQKAYKYLNEGRELQESFPDFYFPTGVYNYYREKYPELYPFYRSFMWLFHSGDMKLGLQQLRWANEKAIFTGTEAMVYLYHINLRYENLPEIATGYVEWLVERYPGNIRFKSLYVEALVAKKAFSQAEPLAKELMKEKELFHKLAGVLFYAMILENRDELDLAEKSLDRAVRIENQMDKNYFHYISMIYATRARIADKRGQVEKAKELYEEALNKDPYVPVRQEAQAYLDR